MVFKGTNVFFLTGKGQSHSCALAMALNPVPVKYAVPPVPVCWDRGKR